MNWFFWCSSKKLMRRLHWNILRFSIAYYSTCVLYHIAVSHIRVTVCSTKMRVHGTGILSAAGPYHDIVSSVRCEWRQQKEKTLSCYSSNLCAASHLPSLQPQLYLLWHATMEISTRLGHRLVNSWHMQVCSLLLFITELGHWRPLQNICDMYDSSHFPCLQPQT